MVYGLEVCLHGYTRINKWSTKFVYMDIHEYTNGLCGLFTWICTSKQMVYEGLFTWIYTNKQMFYEVCLHGYTRINKWFMSLFTWIYTNKQMVYVCLHGYTRINKWWFTWVYTNKQMV